MGILEGWFPFDRTYEGLKCGGDEEATLAVGSLLTVPMRV